MNAVRQYAGLIITSTFLFLNLFIWSAVFAESRSGLLTVAFLDVGQGDAIFIESPNGNQMLIDGGPNGAVLRELSKIMPFHDRFIDVILATHPDKDHIAGLIDVIERYEVGKYLEPGVLNDTGVYQTLLNAVSEKEIPVTYARRGMHIVLDEGVRADILFPDRDVTNVETNSGSIVLRVVYGETEFMLTGDAPQSIERYLMSLDGNDLQSDVLKAGHHGSRTSSDESFISSVHPDIAVISAGKDNSYGHPHKEVLEILSKAGIKIFNTAEEGTIIFTSDGVAITQK
ncbi:MBL fold metallo-hydrolase [Candidatus Kaiserbacteria bacterium]|nr:MBL fold metallo-hydrolase [Candidatus Kaiserbacteria bacterium]